MLKEEKAVRDWKNAAGVDSRLFMREVTAFARAIKENIWQEVEPFIGLDPRHDGHPPDYDKKCPKCMAVRELKAKYAIPSIRRRR